MAPARTSRHYTNPQEIMMRRIRYSVAMSLDGFIAGPNGESDWIVMDPEIDFHALMGEFDAILLGRGTYEATRRMGGGGMHGMTTYVCSKTLRQEECPGTTLVASPEEMLPAIKSLPGKDIWLFGGGSLFGSLLELGLVDTVETAIIPVLLGDGIPLLPHSAGRAKLRLTKSRVYDKTGTTALAYEVI
jgi:dihydrofolate reductase